MYLFHTTFPKELDMILEDGALKCSRLTGLAEAGWGAGQYEENDFVYMSTTDALFDPAVYGCSTLYLNSSVLKRRKFNVANFYNFSSPNIPSEYPSECLKTPYTLYNRVYPPNSVSRDAALAGLSRESKARAPGGIGFQMMNQVSVRDSLDIRDDICGISITPDYFTPENLFSYVNYFLQTYPTIPMCIAPGPELDYRDFLSIVFKSDVHSSVGGASRAEVREENARYMRSSRFLRT